MRELIVDGVPLRDPLGEWFLDYSRSKMLPELERVFDAEPIYGFHGNPQLTPEEAYFTTGKETWVLNVIGSSQADHEENLRGLQGLLQRPELSVVAAPQGTPLNSSTARVGASFNTSVDNQRVAKMRMLGTFAPERIDAGAMRLQLIVENLGAFWSSSAHYATARTLLSSASVVMTLDTTLADSQSPVVDGFVRIKGPIAVGGWVQVADRGNAFRSVRYTATAALGASEFVLIEMSTLRAKLQTSDVAWDMSTGTDVSHRVTTSGDGAFYLSQGIGANWPAGPWSYTVTVTNNLATSAAGVELRVRRSYAA